MIDPNGSILKRLPEGRLAVADPGLSPYGAAALQTLERLGALSTWRPALVQAESVGQVFQLVASGSTVLGFVAVSQVLSGGRIARGSAWIVPSEFHSPLKQDAVLLNAGRNNPAAATFLAYLRSESARATLRTFGYGVQPP